MIDLADWSGAIVRFGFRVKTDPSITDEGLYLRNIRLSWNTNATALDDPALPQGFALGVYPNPFNPRTTVSLSIPASRTGAQLDLALYDLLGRRVATLASEQTLETGQLLLPLDGSGLASGVYLYRLESDGKLDSRKMLLVR